MISSKTCQLILIKWGFKPLGSQDMPVAATCYSSWGCMVARAARKLGPGVLPSIPNPAENDVRSLQRNGSGWSVTAYKGCGFHKIGSLVDSLPDSTEIYP